MGITGVEVMMEGLFPPVAQVLSSTGTELENNRKSAVKECMEISLNISFDLLLQVEGRNCSYC